MSRSLKYPTRLVCALVQAMVMITFTAVLGAADAPPAAHVLVVQGTGIYSREIDPLYHEELEKQGRFLLDSAPWSKLDWALLKNYNAVVLFSTPSLSGKDKTKAFQAKIPLLTRFVSEGGGLLIMGNVQYPIGGELAPLLAPMGADVLTRERIMDDVNAFQQQQYRQEWLLTSRNITRGHPITRGIESITVPGRHYANQPIKVDSEWTVLIKGEKQAYSRDGYSTPPRKTYKTEPPMLACRAWGKGRVVLFAVNASWTIQNGYHRIWEGLVLKPLKPLFDNIYAWLSEPSLAGAAGVSVGKFQLTQRPKEGRNTKDVFAAFPAGINEEKLSVYGGLIGAHSTLSTGKNTPQQWCREAKKRGLSFLIFTEDMASMNKMKWADLVKACAEASDDSFVAMAGMEYRDTGGSRRIIFNLNQYVPPQYWDKEKKVIKNTSGLLWLDWPTVALTDISLSRFSSPVSWQAQKFYNAMVLKSYSRGNLLDDSWDRYKRLTGMYYWLRPITLHRMSSVEEMDGAAGFRTYVLAPNVKDIPEAFRRARAKTPRGNRTFVSDGPMIREFRMIGDGWTIDPWECYYLWNMGEVAPIRMHVTSDVPISDVWLYQGDELVRHYRPLSTEFSERYPHVFSRSGAFYIVVRDVAGRRAVSYSLLMRNEFNWTQMCADLQNTIQSFILPNESGPLRIRGKWRGGAVWGARMQDVTGWSGMKGGGQANIPDGLDTIAGGFKWRELPVTYARDIRENLVSNRLHFVFSSLDASVCRYSDWGALPGGGRSRYWDNSYTELTTYLCEKDTFTVTLAEQKLVARRDIPLADRGKTGLELEITSLWANSKLFPNYTVITKDGRKLTGLRKNLTRPLRVTMAPDGYMAIWPQYWGEGAIYPLDGRSYEVVLKPNETKIGFKNPGGIIVGGTTISTRFAIISGLGVAKDDSQFDAIRKAYGLDGRSAVHPKLTAGKIVDERLILRLRAHEGRVEGLFHKLPLNNRMLVLIENLNPDWPCVVYDRNTRKMTTIGVRPDTATAYWSGYFPKDRRLVIGNAIRAYPTTDERLKISVISAQDGKLKIEVNNPTNDTITATLRRMAGLDVWPNFAKKVTIKPGESRQLDILLR